MQGISVSEVWKVCYCAGFDFDNGAGDGGRENGRARGRKRKREPVRPAPRSPPGPPRKKKKKKRKKKRRENKQTTRSKAKNRSKKLHNRQNEENRRMRSKEQKQRTENRQTEEPRNLERGGRLARFPRHGSFLALAVSRKSAAVKGATQSRKVKAVHSELGLFAKPWATFGPLHISAIVSRAINSTRALSAPGSSSGGTNWGLFLWASLRLVRVDPLLGDQPQAHMFVKPGSCFLRRKDRPDIQQVFGYWDWVGRWPDFGTEARANAGGEGF